jgi:hypothetical protein
MGRPGRGQVNPGWFQPGDDPRRHPLTHAERQRGGSTTFQYLLEERPEVLLWLKKQIRARRQRKCRG